MSSEDSDKIIVKIPKSMVPHSTLMSNPNPNSGNFRSRPDGSHYPMGNTGPNPIDEAVKRMNEKRCSLCGKTSSQYPQLQFIDAPEIGGFVCKECIDKKAVAEAQKQDVKDYTYPDQQDEPEEKHDSLGIDSFGKGIFD